MMTRTKWFQATLLMGALVQPIAAQEVSKKSTPDQAEERLQDLSTLESIRSERGGMSGGARGGGMSSGMGADEKRYLLQYIHQLRRRLTDPKQNRVEVEMSLKAALAEYFVFDMEERVREFDKIKARLNQMELKLQKRLDQRFELVDLQTKQMLATADGLEFLIPQGNSEGGYGSAGVGDGSYGGGGEGMGGGMAGYDEGMGAGGMGAGYGDGMGPGGMSMGMSSPGMGPGMGGAPGSAPGMRMGGAPGMGMGGAPGMGMGYEPGQTGYDFRFEITRFIRFPGKSLEPNDPLQIYQSLDRKSDEKNELARTGARATAQTKMKNLLLAMHNFENLFHHFPAPANQRYRSEFPHSWRVALLPILGHAELYKQYRFDEPWDGENNRKLIEKMPPIFASQDASQKGETKFQMITEGGATFESSRITRMSDITDGTSNTIALAVASTSVPWTKPEDIQFEPNAMIPKLDPSLLVGMCDGSVKTVNNIPEFILAHFITRAGGEVVATLENK